MLIIQALSNLTEGYI